MVQQSTHRPLSARGSRRGGLLGAAAGLALALGGLVVGAAPAQAHDQLVGADPGVNATVQQAPEKVDLQFSADVTPVGNEIRVTDSHGAVVSDGDPSVSGHTVTEKIKPASGDETYTVTWRVVSSDGHPVQGSFGFVVGQGGSGEHTALPSQPAHHDDDDDDHDHSESAAAAAGGQTSSPAAQDSSQQDQKQSEGMPLWLVAVIGAVFVLVVLGLILLLVARRRDRGASRGDERLPEVRDEKQGDR